MEAPLLVKEKITGDLYTIVSASKNGKKIVLMRIKTGKSKTIKTWQFTTGYIKEIIK